MIIILVWGAHPDPTGEILEASLHQPSDAWRYFFMIFYALQYLSITVNLGFKGGVGSELRMYQGNTPKELFQIHSNTQLKHKTQEPQLQQIYNSLVPLCMYLCWCQTIQIHPARWFTWQIARLGWSNAGKHLRNL